ncbi:MAG: GreA/GreB family elongation factor [Candidatus Paceibacterota bacterium]
MNKDQFVKNFQEALEQLSVRRSGAQKHNLTKEIQNIDLTPSKNKNVKIGSLVTIENEINGEKTIEKYFIFPEGAGTIIKNGTEIVVVISPGSPVGNVLLGKKERDLCKVKTPGGIRFFVIKSVE